MQGVYDGAFINSVKKSVKDLIQYTSDLQFIIIFQKCPKTLDHYKHTRTKAYSPQTNGICERFHKTMKNECYDVMFGRKIYGSLEEIEKDIEQWLTFYNTERPHSGRYCYGKTPWETWLASKSLVKEKQLDHLFKPSDTQTPLTNSMA